MKTGQFYRSWYCKSVEIGVRREANHSQVGHLARICDNVWRRFSTLLFSELANQDTSSYPLFFRVPCGPVTRLSICCETIVAMAAWAVRRIGFIRRTNGRIES